MKIEAEITVTLKLIIPLNMSAKETLENISDSAKKKALRGLKDLLTKGESKEASIYAIVPNSTSVKVLTYHDTDL